jgi:hypothetical protein
MVVNGNLDLCGGEVTKGQGQCKQGKALEEHQWQKWVTGHGVIWVDKT